MPALPLLALLVAGITNNVANPVASITFPAATGGSKTETFMELVRWFPRRCSLLVWARSAQRLL